MVFDRVYREVHQSEYKPEHIPFPFFHSHYVDGLFSTQRLMVKVG